jgi:hypothetical protein
MSDANIPVAVPTPAHHFHFNLGKVLALIVLGLEAYKLQDSPGKGPSSLLEPGNLNALIAGVQSIFPKQTDPTT